MDNKYVFDKMIFGNRIKKARKQKNLTQEALSNILNINVNTLAKWESPQNKLTLSYTNLIALVNALGIDLNYLFRNEEAEQEHNQHTQNISNLIESLTEKERNIVSILINSLIDNRE